MNTAIDADRVRAALPAALVATLAGVAGVAGSYALAGFTPEFIVAPIATFTSQTMPAAVVTFAITTLGDLGERINLATAALLAVALLAATVLSGVNALLLAALCAVWLRNYRTFRTPLVLGLVSFSGVLVVENAVVVYYFLSVRMLFTTDPTVQRVVLGLRALQLLALALLTYVTMK